MKYALVRLSTLNYLTPSTHEVTKVGSRSEAEKMLRNKNGKPDQTVVYRAGKDGRTDITFQATYNDQGELTLCDYALIAVRHVGSKNPSGTFDVEVSKLAAAFGPVRTRRVRNLMSNLEIDIPVNTPSYLDPSCEAYWSM